MPSLTLTYSNPTPPQRTVLLGAGGFVGRHCARLLSGQGDLLTLTRKVIDLLDPSSHVTLSSFLQEGDTLLVTSALAPCKSGEMLIDNLKMMEQVCKAIALKKPSHLVYISSDAVYRDSSQRIDESSCAQPDSFHGVMHLAREVMLRNSFSGPFAIVRPTLIYGAEDPHNGYGPNSFVRLALQNKTLSLFGKGEELRDHIAVEEVAEIVRRVILHRATGVVNAVTGNEISFYDIAALVQKLTAGTGTIQENPRKGPMPHNGYRAFDPLSRKVAFPDFECRSIEEGLSLMIQKLKN